jgi:hypothetical protein
MNALSEIDAAKATAESPFGWLLRMIPARVRAGVRVVLEREPA